MDTTFVFLKLFITLYLITQINSCYGPSSWLSVTLPLGKDCDYVRSNIANFFCQIEWGKSTVKEYKIIYLNSDDYDTWRLKVNIIQKCSRTYDVTTSKTQNPRKLKIKNFSTSQPMYAQNWKFSRFTKIILHLLTEFFRS